MFTGRLKGEGFYLISALRLGLSLDPTLNLRYPNLVGRLA